MKPLVSSLAITIAFLSAIPSVLTLANPGSTVETAGKTQLLAYQASVQPHTSGGAIAEQFSQHLVSQMPTSTVNTEPPKPMTAPAKADEKQPSSSPKLPTPGCQSGNESKATTDSFADLEAQQLCRFGS